MVAYSRWIGWGNRASSLKLIYRNYQLFNSIFLFQRTMLALAACSGNGRATGTNVHTRWRTVQSSRERGTDDTDTGSQLAIASVREGGREKIRKTETLQGGGGHRVGGRGYTCTTHPSALATPRCRWVGVLAWRRHRARAHTHARACPPRPDAGFSTPNSSATWRQFTRVFGGFLAGQPHHSPASRRGVLSPYYSVNAFRVRNRVGGRSLWDSSCHTACHVKEGREEQHGPRSVDNTAYIQGGSCKPLFWKGLCRLHCRTRGRFQRILQIQNSGADQYDEWRSPDANGRPLSPLFEIDTPSVPIWLKGSNTAQKGGLVGVVYYCAVVRLIP